MGAPGHVVVAPDKFTGSLTASEVAAALAQAIRRCAPKVQVRRCPLADGGEGTVDVLVGHGYVRVAVGVSGPTGALVEAAFARDGRTAVVELAEASGLRRLPGGRFDPLLASSRGTGELILAALDSGCDRLVIGVGGSACTDGGAGMLQALGVSVLDDRGLDVRPGGGHLRDVSTIDVSGLDRRIPSTEILLASDVDNPLLGPAGAAAVFSPQKGATAAHVLELEAALCTWSRAVARATDGTTVTDSATTTAGAPGAGAAGGVGFACLAVLGARRRPGIDVMLDLLDVDATLDGARLVITGEGSLDEQSLRGKVPIGVGRAAAEHGVPVVAVAGRSTLSASQVAAAGLAAAYPLTLVEADVDVCMRDASRLLERLVERFVGPRWLVG